jgi:hypothetical protein
MVKRPESKLTTFLHLGSRVKIHAPTHLPILCDFVAYTVTNPRFVRTMELDECKFGMNTDEDSATDYRWPGWLFLWTSVYAYDNYHKNIAEISIHRCQTNMFLWWKQRNVMCITPLLSCNATCISLQLPITWSCGKVSSVVETRGDFWSGASVYQASNTSRSERHAIPRGG